MASVALVKPTERPLPPSSSRLAWSFAALLGVVAPFIAMLLLLLDAPGRAPGALASGPIPALALMGTAMIAAAILGRFWIGVLLAISSGAALILLADVLDLLSLRDPLAAGFAVFVASLSFAARGTLFARSAADRGWWIALFVVAGEAAILLTAAIEPDALPDWLLALLPAQWASMALHSALEGGDALAAGSALVALGGTAAATLLVWRLWPRRWPYLIMFGTWLALSALVYHRPGPPSSHATAAITATPADQRIAAIRPEAACRATASRGGSRS